MTCWPVPVCVYVCVWFRLRFKVKDEPAVSDRNLPSDQSAHLQTWNQMEDEREGGGDGRGGASRQRKSGDGG